jgi:tape measure domain-containing protein
MSKSVEERIVKMRFDNAGFEKGVAETKKSLEELNKKVEMKNTSKGLDELTKSASRVNLSPLSNSVEQVSVKFSALNTIAETVFRNLTTSAMQTGSKIVNALISPIVQGGKTRAMNLANAQFQIEGLFGTAKDLEGKTPWEKLLDDINYGVEDTAYGLDVAAKAAAQFGASGVQAGDDMKTALRAISGVAAMTNSDYESIADIFTTISGNGRVFAMQLNQLSSRGLNAAATLAKSLGVTEAEVRDMVSKGKIDFATFSKAMDEAFGEHAKKANDTFTGALSNMKAALARIGAEFWSPFLTVARDVFNALTPIFKKLQKLLSVSIIASINENVRKIADQAIGWFNNIDAGLKKAQDGLAMFIPIWKHQADKYGQVIEGEQQQAEEAWANLIAFTGKSKEELMNSEEYYAAVVFSSIKNSLESVRETMSAAFSSIVNAFKLVTNFIGFKSDILSIVTIIQNVTASIKNVVTAVSNGLANISKKVAETRFGMIASLSGVSSIWTGEMSSIISLLFNLISNVSGKLSVIIERVMTIIGFVLEGAQKIYITVSAIVAKIVLTIVNRIRELRFGAKSFVDVWHGVFKFLETGMNAFGKLLTFIFEVFDNAWTNGIYPIISVFLSFVFSIRDIVVEAINVILTAIGKLFSASESALPKLISMVKDDLFGLLQKIGELLNGVAEVVRNVIVPAFKYLWDAIQPTFAYIRDSFKSIIKESGLYDKAIKLIATITDYWKGKIDKVKASIDKLTRSLKDETSIANGWKKAVDKIVSVLDKLAHKLVDAAGKFIDFAKNIKNTMQKSGVFTTVAEAIKNIFNSIKDTFSNLGPVVSSLRNTISQFIASAGGSLITVLANLASTIISKLGPAIVKILDLFNAFLNASIKMGSNLKDKLSPAFKDISGSVKKVSDSFGGFVGGKISSITKFFDDFAKGTHHIQAVAEDGSVIFDDTVTKAERASQNYKAVAEYYKEGTKTISHEMRYSSKNMSDAVVQVAEANKKSKTVSENIDDTVNNLLFRESSGSLLKDMASFAGGSYLGIFKGSLDTINGVREWLQDLSPQMAGLLGFATAGMYTSVKTAQGLAGFAHGLSNLTSAGDSIATAVKNLTKTLDNFGKYLSKLGTAAIIKGIGIALLELVAAFAILVLIVHFADPSDIIIAGIIIAAFFAAMIALTVMLADKVEVLEDGTKKINPSRFKSALKDFSKSLMEIGAGLIMVSLSVAVLVFAIKQLKDIKWDEIKDGLTALAALLFMITMMLAIIVRAGATTKTIETGTKALMKSATSIKNLGKALIMYSVAVYVLAKALKNLQGIKYEDIQDGLFAITALMSLFILIMEVMKSSESRFNIGKGKFSGSGKSSALFQTEAEAHGMSAALRAFAGSILIISISLRLLSGIDEKDLKAGLNALESLLGIFAGLMAIVSFRQFTIKDKAVLSFNNNAKMIKTLGGAMLAFGTSVGILAGALWVMSKISKNDLDRGLGVTLAFITAIGIFISAMLILTKDSGKGRMESLSVFIQALGLGMMEMSASLLILSGALYIIAQIDTASLITGGIVLGAFLAGIAAIMMYVQKHIRSISKNWKAFAIVAGFISAMAVDMVILAAAIKIISTIDIPSQFTSIIALVVALGAIAALVYAVLKFKEQITSGDAIKALEVVGGFFLAMSATMLLIASAIRIIGGLDTKPLVTAAGSLLAFLVAFGASVALITVFADQIGRAWPAFAVLGGTLLALAASMLMYAKALKMLSEISKEGADNIAYVVETGGKALISLLPMLGTSIAGFLVNLVSELAASADKIATSIAEIIAQIVAAIAARIPEMVRNLLESIVSSLSILIEFIPRIVDLVFDFLIKVIEAVTNRLPELVGKVVQMLYTFFASVIDALGDIDMSKLIQGLAAVGLLTAITLGLAAVSLLIPLAMVGLMGVAAMAVMMTEVFSALASIGGFGAKIDKATEVVIKLGNMIGSFIGSLVGSMAEQFSSHLPAIGESFSAFSETIAPFINNISSLNTDNLMGNILGIAGAMALLGGAEVISLLTGVGMLPELAKNYSAFAENMKPFFEICGGLSEESVAGAEALAKIVMAIAAAELIDGITLFTSIEDTIESFSKKLPGLGTAMKEFSDNIKGIDNEAVKAAAEAAKNLGEMAAALPNSGGLAAFFAGENDLDTFGEQLEKFGVSLVKFSDSVSKEGAVNPEAISRAVEAGKALAELQTGIEKIGGVAAFFAGENDFETFSNGIVSFGNSLAWLSVVAVNVNPEVVQKVVDAGTALAGLQSSMENVGGVVSWFTGDKNFETFATGIVALGDALAKLSETASDVNPTSCMTVISTFADIGDKISTLADITIGDILQIAWQYGPALEEIGSSMKKLSQNLSEFNASVVNAAIISFHAITDLAIYISAHTGEMSGAIKPMEEFGDAIYDLSKRISSSDVDSLGELAGALSELTPQVIFFGNSLIEFTNAAIIFGESYQGIINTFVDATNLFILTISSIIENLTNAIPIIGEQASNLITTLSDTLQKTADQCIPIIFATIVHILDTIINTLQFFMPTIKAKGEEIMNILFDGAMSKQGSVLFGMVNIALNIARGLANGLTSNSAVTAVKSGISSLIQHIPETIRKLLRIASPSKVMIAIARFIPMGIAKGITDNSYMVEHATENMANAMSQAIEDSINSFEYLSDFNPTIRPVVDMTDIRKNSGEISSLFGNYGTSMSMAARISARYSNGKGDPYYDITKAINKVHDDLSELDANNYTINGITYDDGTAVATAVNDLLRATRIGRRA